MLTEAEFCNAVVEMIRLAETRLPKDVARVLEKSARETRNPVAKLQLETMLENVKLAEKSKIPICQDTGTLFFFVKLGQKTRLGFDLKGAINSAVERATREVPLRTNLVDPLTRKPTKAGPRQPAVHIELAGGEKLELDLLVKGAGSENWSRLFMMKPAEGSAAVRKAVLATLEEAGGRPCPPVIVGLGVGGSAETAPILARLALLRRIDKPNPDPALAKLEREIELAANKLEIGPMGLGGRPTVLRVLIEKAACHTASLPVAVAIQCWVARKAKARLTGGKIEVIEP
jgi:fumarate hydratase subunit alpha